MSGRKGFLFCCYFFFMFSKTKKQRLPVRVYHSLSYCSVSRFPTQFQRHERSTRKSAHTVNRVQVDLADFFSSLLEDNQDIHHTSEEHGSFIRNKIN
jgi:hypothetical protein